MTVIDETSELVALIEEGQKLGHQKNKRALETFDRAIVLARQQANIWYYAFALIAKANYYSFVLNDTAKALTVSNEAKRWISDTDPSLMGHFEACLGNIYYLQGDQELAQKNYLSAIKHLESVEHKSKFDIERLPGVYYNSYILFLYTRADDIFGNVEHLNRAIELYQQNGNKGGMMVCYNALAHLYLTRMQPIEKSVEMALKSCEYEAEVDDPSVAAISCSIAGLFLTKADRYEEAKVYFDKADRHLSKIEHQLYSAMLLHNKGEAFMHLKRFKEAVDYLKRAEEIYKAIHADEESVKVSELLADAYSGACDFEHAFEYERMFRKARVDEEANQRLTAIAQAKSQFETEIKEREAKLLREKNREIENYARQLEFSKERQAELEELRHTELKKEKDRSDSLLLNILPPEVADELKQTGACKAKFFEDVTVLFTDFKDFTTTSENLSPQELVNELDACFKVFDGVMDKYGIEKIKTVGDAYMAASGLPVPSLKHAEDMVKAAIEIRDFMLNRKKELGHKTFDMRIGLHSGSVVAGIVGVRKFVYDIWGDAVNVASRMEQHGEPGKINISGATYQLVKDEFKCIHRGKIHAKNKGEIDMYFVDEQAF